jgi:hypothetical protein
VIGLHSHTHPTRPAGVDWLAEYVENGRILTAALPGWHPVVASHPCNLTSPVADEALTALGVTVAFNATLAPYKGSLHYPREDSHDARKRVMA